MPAKKTAKKSHATHGAIDPRSDEVVLHYLGDEAGEPHVGNFPARDLTGGDIARLVFVGSDAEDRITGEHDDYDKACSELIALLVETEVYTTDIPAPTAPADIPPAPIAPDGDAPADPATSEKG